ncbi:uncharacterized protein LOC126320457 [Schistocerca gregaria]|uniref:uncharacterized protein LOC126320457 n=1 Tax=Schistocerca gregaria TaxID=7010 RepID=UPI00211E6295|nr:uncharacterized protein LOC126320457 [Schistocerca gregaria]
MIASVNQLALHKVVNCAEPIPVKISDLKQTVFISDCVDASFIIQGKCTSITVTSSRDVNIIFDGVVSSVELIRCRKISAQANGSLPVITIEKCEGANIYLFSEASRSAEIITSLSLEVIITIPPKVGQDAIERAIPYQFVTVLKDDKLETKPVTHTAN